MSNNLAQERIMKTRQLVLEYLATHSVSDKLNRMVNDLCRSRPRDPWLFLTDALSDHQREAPLIDRLVARNGLSNSGDSSLQLNIYGRVSPNRPPKHMSTENMLLKPKNFNTVDALTGDDGKENNKENDSATSGTNENENNNGNNSETSLISQVQSLITQFISPNLRDLKLNEQFKIDDELKKLYFEKLETIQSMETQFDLILSMSILSAITASKSLKKPLYLYLDNFYVSKNQVLTINNNNSNNLASASGNDTIGRNSAAASNNDSSITSGVIANEPNRSDLYDSSNLTLPNIMCILTQSDNLPSIGASFSETIDPSQRIAMMKRLSETIEENMDSGKKGKDSGTSAMRDESTGALIVNQFKKFDELFKFINDCVEKCKFEDFESGLISFSLIFSNNGFVKYDTDTNKYTVYGEKKPMENSDLVSYYSKIVSNYSNITYLEDAMDASDTDGFTLLCSELSDKVNIVGNELYNGSLEQIQTGLQQKWTLSVCVPTYRIFTITNLCQIAKYIENLYNVSQTLVIDDTFDSNASLPYFVDVAVACRCGLLRLPLPSVKHANQKYNRYLFLNDELKASNEAALQDIVQETKPPNSVLPPTEEEPEALP